MANKIVRFQEDSCIATVSDAVSCDDQGPVDSGTQWRQPIVPHQERDSDCSAHRQAGIDIAVFQSNSGKLLACRVHRGIRHAASGLAV